MSRLPDPELLDEDAPEADEAWFARARPAADVLAELFEPAQVEEILAGVRIVVAPEAEPAPTS